LKAIKIGNTMKALVAVLVIALSVSMVVADEAELIVAKTIMTRNPVANAEMLVSVRIFNVGTGYVLSLRAPDEARKAHFQFGSCLAALS
jgi:phosphoribosylaminoimidazole (AIR) synthetase